MSSKKLKREDSFGWLIAVVSQQMGYSLDARLKKYGLNLSLWPTLFLLWQQEGYTQTELSKACQTRNYTTTRVLDKLEELELVARRPDPESRRAFRVYLTDKGRELEPELIAEAKAVNKEYLSKLDKNQRAQLMSLMQLLIS
ncbi:MarR family winged helix-turn-helix transcriptional regulator [Spartinivicinus poritis]|uniref:MarR family transcriptional regulator n=1 Tax=Spartinivicinus poritis TaxID=2994640 RepID=A0ABT5U6Q2_9GAMM|nr:MarR family transcriptional regulator [Spartinivicinus sp. A2-2]MDE1461656.1 MarR family transcriptional regulator [Spartinivicinus sp. A2-2]